MLRIKPTLAGEKLEVCSVTLSSETRESHRISKEEITIVYMHLTACLDTYDLFFFFLLLKSLQSKCVVILNLQFHLRSMPNISCHFHKVNVFRLSKEQCIYLINLGKLKQGNTSFPSVFLLLGIQRNNPPSRSITTYSPILLFLSVPIAY